ncbi:MAG TPA: NAD-dependent epimerase/dehydratase family protein [Pyrinomonadaceae bacterium]|nr:NAD-dependent epimerase/dehydratase family protein [Pyrinomonadaceae bacterium]
MKVLVTGGSGYLGTHVRRFFDADDFSRRSNLNILDESDLGLISNYDVVIHLAAHLEKVPEAAKECFSVNAEGTANVLRHMSSGSVFIYASTKDVYGPHANYYDEVPEGCSVEYSGQTALEWSKLIGEHYVQYYTRRRSLRACIFRLSTVYARASEGNESGFVTHYVESVERRWPIRVPLGGSPVRDILHVEDLSRACQAFIDSARTHGLYNLGGGRRNSATLRKIIESIGQLIEVEPVIAEDQTLPHPVPVNYVSDLTRIHDELGWQPKISMEEGLRSLL